MREGGYGFEERRRQRVVRPLVDAIRRHLLAGAKLHADHTLIPVLAPGNGKTKTARLWTYVRDDRPSGETTPPGVGFAYTLYRKGIHPQTHITTFKGILQADAYAGFKAIYGDGTTTRPPAGLTRGANPTTCMRPDPPH